MKTLFALLLAATAAVSTLQAHCGSCSVDEMHGNEKSNHSACSQKMLDGYFSIQQALAGDDLTAAQSASTSLIGDIEASECSSDGESCCVEYHAAAKEIKQASSIAAARKAFQSFSNALIEQVESHGSETAAYQMHCPMAFGNKGASWLQKDGKLKNPYFGSQMLACGMQEAVHGGQTESGDHGGHSH